MSLGATAGPAVELRDAIAKLLAALLKATSGEAAQVSAGLCHLRQVAWKHTSMSPARRQACVALDRLANTSLRVLRLCGGHDLEIRCQASWTLEITDSEVHRCQGDLGALEELDALYDFLLCAVNRNLKYYRLGDPESEEFYLWFHSHYQAWLQIVENCRAAASDAAVPHPRLQMPFVFPWMRYDGATLARFVNAVVRRGLGNEASMLTVIEDEGDTPYVLYEQITGGSFGLARLFKAQSLAEVRAVLAAAGLPVVYVKRVDVEYLRQTREEERKYVAEGDKRRHMVAVLSILAHHVGFDPLPPFAVGLLSAWRDVHLPKGQSGATGTALPEPLLPNLDVQVGGEGLRVDTGGTLTLRLADSLVLELIGALSHVRGLAAAYESVSLLLARALASRSIKLAAPGLLGAVLRLVPRRSVRQVPALLRTMTWSMRLLGSPLRIVVQAGEVGFLLHFLDGRLARVDMLSLDARARLGKVWLKLCQDPTVGFVHFAFRVPSAALRAAGVTRSAKANLRLAALRAAPRRESDAKRLGSDPLYYPENAIAEALLGQFKGLGLLRLCDFLAGPVL